MSDKVREQTLAFGREAGSLFFLPANNDFFEDGEHSTEPHDSLADTAPEVSDDPSRTGRSTGDLNLEFASPADVDGFATLEIESESAAPESMAPALPGSQWTAHESDLESAHAGASGSPPALAGSPYEGTVAGVLKSGNAYIDALLYGDPNGVRWTGTPVSYSFPNDFIVYGAYSHTISGFAQVSFEQRTAVRSILGDSAAALGSNGFTYGSVASFTNLAFQDLNNFSASGDINVAETNLFDGANLNTARVADFPRLDQRSDGGDVWFGNDYAGTSNDYRAPVMGNYAWITHVHELGHALGLKHTHNLGGGTVVMPADRDGMEFTVMSYRSYINGPTTGYTNEQWGYAQTFMMMDIQALQYLYGADYTTNATNSTYSWDPSTGAMSINGVVQGTPGGNRVFLTIWDGGGTDTYDFSNYTTNLNVDLTPGGWSTLSSVQLAYLGGGNYARANVYNALLYQGNTASIIENAVGGTGNDLIRGNQVANTLTGGDGSDILYGESNLDTLNGGSGNDLLYGGFSTDTVDGGSGNDQIIVLEGEFTDDANGGADVDTYHFGDITTRYIGINLVAGTLQLFNGNGTAFGPQNSVIGIENVIGTALDDGVIGNASVNIFFGLAGNDRLDGGAGADTMLGGLGDDAYIVAAAGDVTFENAGEGTDTVFSYINWTLGANIERLDLEGSATNATGNALNNTLVGNSLNNLLNGAGGNDYMRGGAGNDIYIVAAAGDFTDEDPGQGADTVRSYINWTLGADVERLELKGSGNLNGTGNTLANTLVGTSGNNVLNGGNGNDFISAGAGNDTLNGGAGNDTLIGAAGRDTLNGGTGNDVFDFDLVSHSPAGAATRDSIVGGFSHGFDDINLATIDANTLAGGNQAFSFIGSAGFSGVAGQLRYSNFSGTVIVYADVNGDSAADMQILVAGTNFMTGTDFIV